MSCWEKWKPTIWSLQMKLGSKPTHRALKSLLDIWGSFILFFIYFFNLKCVWHCWAPVGRKETCLSLLCSWQCRVGCWWELCASRGKEMVPLTRQLQPTLLCARGCDVPWVSPPGEVWILLNGFGFFLFHFGLPLTETLWSACQGDIPVLCFRVRCVTGAANQQVFNRASVH